MYKTDIDRLHAVANGDLVGRQRGQTTLDIHELASLVELRDPDIEYIFCKTHRFEDINHLKPMVDKIFNERGINHVWDTQDRMFIMGFDGWVHVEIGIMFVSESQWEKETHRFGTIGFVDMRWGN